MGAWWIIIGVIYLGYRYCRDELGESSGEAIVGVIKGFLIMVGIVLVGLFIHVLAEVFYSISLTAGEIFLLLLCIPLVAFLIFIFKIEYTEQTKDETLPDEVTNLCIKTGAQLLRNPSTSLFRNPQLDSDTATMEAFRQHHFDICDEYLPAKEAFEYASCEKEARKKLGEQDEQDLTS